MTGSLGRLVDPPPPIALVAAVLAAPPVPVLLEELLALAADESDEAVALLEPKPLVVVVEPELESVAVAVAVVAVVVAVVVVVVVPLVLASALLSVTEALACVLLPVVDTAESPGAVSLHPATSATRAALARRWDDVRIPKVTVRKSDSKRKWSHSVSSRANTKFFHGPDKLRGSPPLAGVIAESRRRFHICR